MGFPFPTIFCPPKKKHSTTEPTCTDQFVKTIVIDPGMPLTIDLAGAVLDDKSETDG